MDIFRVSDGAFERLDVSLHDFPSLDALRKATSRLIDIPLPNLIIFHSSGSQLGDSLYSELGHLAAAHSFSRSAQRRDGRDRDTPGNEHELEHGRADQTGGTGIALYAFDRESFMADPYDFVQGIQEDLFLTDPLPPQPPQPFSTADVTDLFQQNIGTINDLTDRLRAQERGLELATGSLGEHLGRILSEGGELGTDSKAGNDRGADGIGTGTGTGGGRRTLIARELARELSLVHSNEYHPSPSPSLTHQPVQPTDKTEGTGKGVVWGMEQDLHLIGLISINPFFLLKRKSGRAGGVGVGGGGVHAHPPLNGNAGIMTNASTGTNQNLVMGEGKKKMLGDWVSESKMGLVRDTCRRTYEDHSSRYTSLMTDLDRVTQNARGMMDEIPLLIEEAEQRVNDVQLELREIWDALQTVVQGVGGGVGGWEEIRFLDGLMRDQVVEMTNLKNLFTLTLHIHLHGISAQQSAIAELTPRMNSLEESLLSTRTLAKTGFPHLHRLRGMLGAYGLACVEVAWRKGLGDLLHEGAGRLVDSLGTHLERERERRKGFRNDVLGLLPYEIEGLSEKTEDGELGPSVDLSVVSGDIDLEECDISRTTLPELLGSFERLKSDPVLADFIRDDTNPIDVTLSTMKSQMGTMSTELEQLRILWIQESRSQGDGISERRADSILLLEDEKAQAISPSNVPQRSISALGDALRHESRLDGHNDRVAPVVASLLEQIEKLRTENQELRQRSRRQSQTSDQDVQSSDIARLNGKIAQLDHEKEIVQERLRSAVKDLEEERLAHKSQLQNLEADRSQILQGLSDARKDEEALARKVLQLQTELEAALHSVEEVKAQRDTALEAQAISAEKVLRDRLAEAHGDRAVLENQTIELAKEVEGAKTKASADLHAAEARHTREMNGLKAEMGMIKAELREAQRKVSQSNDVVIQEQDRAGVAKVEKERQEEFSKEAIKIASVFHDCVSRLHLAIQSSATISGSVSGTLPGKSAVESASNAAIKESTMSSMASADYLLAELQTLKNYDLNAFSEAVSRTMSLVKKWQKSCKQYRERSKNQIAFASFTKGDLALFLPTRNASAKSWAAFNIASPHYFLKPTSGIEQMMQEREWIVGRITAVEEGVVDHHNPSAGKGFNPYGLAEGIRYHELEAEVYVPTPARPRRSVSTGSQIENSKLQRMSSLVDHRPSAPLSSPAVARKSSGGYFPPLLDSAGRPILERSRDSAENSSHLRLGSQPAPHSFRDAVHASVKSMRRPSSVASSSASSSKFGRGIQLGMSGTGKAGSVVGVTREGLVDRLSQPPLTISSNDSTAIDPDGRVKLSESPSTTGLTIPGAVRDRRSSHTASISDTGRSPRSPGSPILGGLARYARVAGLRASAEASSRGSTSAGGRGGFSVGEGALDILKRIGENKSENTERNQ